MPKSDNESFLDYKKRILDPVSDSFCAAKWFNATMWLDRGWTTSCHLPPHHKASRWDVRWNPSALHNTRHKKKMRKQMLKGERPKECDYCWKVEDMKQDAVSDRVFKSVIYNDADVKALADKSARLNIGLKTLELSFDRVCNFACSYCNPGFSTTWSKDIKANGPYDLKSLGTGMYRDDGAREVIDPEKNPYLRAFWKWWPDLCQSLEELRISGGEPLMSKDCWRLLDHFRESRLDHIRLAMNSNLGANDELIERLIAKSHDVKHFEIYTSNESFGAHAEYIRDGLNYEKWRSNVKKLKTKGNFKRIHIMMTINALCLFSITDLFDDVLSWRHEIGPDIGHWTMNLVRFPSFMSALVLPRSIRDSRRQHLMTWLNENQSHPYLLDFEKAGIHRLIKYLELVDVPHDRTSTMDVQQRDFVSYYQQFDKRRNKDFYATFPAELTDWMKMVPGI